MNMVKQENKGQEQTDAVDAARSGQWLKLSFMCPAIVAEAATDLLAVRSGSGVEQSPESAEGIRLSGFFYVAAADGQTATEQMGRVIHDIRTELAELFILYRQPLPDLHHDLLADEDWATSWQQYFKPFTIAPGLVIKPSWEEYESAPGEQVLQMDPGMAFGTGQHASTRGALQLIRRSIMERNPARVLDVGTGTGILAMGAALWGVPEVLAVDNDPEAVRVAGENIGHNLLAERIRVAATPVADIQGSFDLVCANIVHDVLVDMLPQLSRLVARPGHLVLAGILAGAQERNIAGLYAQAGFILLGYEHEAEWASLLFTR